MRHLGRAIPSTLLLLAACADDGAPAVRRLAEDVDLRMAIGPEGGEISSKGVRLAVPEGALAEPVELAVRTVRRGDERALPARVELESRAYALTPHGQRFERDVELEFPYREPEEGRSPRLARLEDAQDERWEEVRGARFEGEAVSVRLDRFSIYAVVSCEADADADCGLDPTREEPPDGGTTPDAGEDPDGSAASDARAEPRPDADMGEDAGGQGDTDAAVPEGGVQPFAQLGVSPAEASFGNVALADAQSQPVTLTFENTGTGDATGCSVSANDQAFVPFNDGCTGTLAAGESCTVDVRGEVSAPGTISGAVLLQCDADLVASVDLSVTGVEPLLVVTPTVHSFGPVPSTTTETLSVTFANDGLAPATGCSAPTLTGSDPGLYALQSDGCGTADLPAGSSCAVTVAYSPGTDTAERRATLQRTCAVGGTVSTAADGLVANRPHYLFIREAEALTGDLGGLAGADAICQQAADAGSLTGGLGLTWRALLSTSTVDARDRIDWQGPVFDIRNIHVVADPTVWPWATSTADPGTPNLLEATENGGSPGSYVWTGTSADGTWAGAGLSCADWTSALAAEDAQVGETGSFPDANWLASFTNACDDDFFSLICISDYP